MIDIEGFKSWLKSNCSFSSAVISDMASRIKRADKIKEWYYDDLYLFYLEKEEGFKTLSVSVKSQIRKAVKLYNNYHTSTFQNKTQ